MKTYHRAEVKPTEGTPEEVTLTLTGSREIERFLDVMGSVEASITTPADDAELACDIRNMIEVARRA